jgi:hypothetical protein
MAMREKCSDKAFGKGVIVDNEKKTYRWVLMAKTL